jgi:hypothetical protein
MHIRERRTFRFVPEDAALPSFQDWDRTLDYSTRHHRTNVFADYAEILRSSLLDLERFRALRELMAIMERAVLMSETWDRETWLTEDS